MWSRSTYFVKSTGGGSCAAGDLDHNGSFESGQSCALTYADPTERDEMGTANTPFMKNLGTSGQSDGIWSPDPVSNPVFSRFHRVRVEKCSYDRHTGRATHAGLTATAPGGASINYTLYQHGQKIVLMALEALRGQGAGNPGLSYTTLVANGGVVAPTTVTLPSMADATQVVILGHSGAAHGLYHNADRYAQRLRSWPGFQGDVRAVHDANFQASTESEAIFDPGQSAGLFDQVYSGNTAELGAYDAVPYYSSSIFTEQARAWLEQPGDGLETIFDASCVAAHQSAGDTWKCRDKWHVRFHHETTPAFLREDFSDPGGDHTNNGLGYDVSWGPLGAYTHCAKLGFTPCPPRIATGPGSPYVARLNAQAQDYLQHILTGGELASGADPSPSAEPVAPAPRAARSAPRTAAPAPPRAVPEPRAEPVEPRRSRATLRELADRFIREYVDVYLKDGTAMNYRRCITNVIVPALGDREFDTITRRDAQTLHASMRATPFCAFLSGLGPLPSLSASLSASLSTTAHSARAARVASPLNSARKRSRSNSGDRAA